MAIEFFHAHNESAIILRRLFRTGRRNFEHGLRTAVMSFISESREICEAKNAEKGRESVAIRNGIAEISRDIGLIFNGGIVIEIGEISPDDLSQEISVRICGNKLHRNSVIFIPVSVFKTYKSNDCLSFLDPLLNSKDIQLSKKVKYHPSDIGFGIEADEFVGGNKCWISESVIRSSTMIDEILISNLNYLHGAKKK